MDADVVVVAIGQCLDASFVDGAEGLNLEERATVVVDADTMATNLPGVFAGGDVVTTRGTVTEAMAAGRMAALSIDRYLKGLELREGSIPEAMTISEEQIPRFVECRKRQQAPRLPVTERVRSFKEVDLSLTEESALSEAKRCLNCPMCGNCMFYRSQMCYEVATKLL